jgi:photosystem II stability/assembly factor-like uncharacterized protein
MCPRNRSHPGRRRFAARTLAAMTFAGGLAAWAPLAAAATGLWQTLGPAGGTVLGLAVDPSAPGTLYAAAGGGGLYKTLDGGRSWNHRDAGLIPNFVLQVVVDPVAPSTLYAATANGLFRSGDGGSSWTPSGSGLVGVYVTCVAIDPRAHRTLYAGTDTQVWKSLDGAASWRTSANGLPLQEVGSLAVDPRQPGTIYAGTATGIFKSVNGGITWRPARAGIGAFDVMALTVDPKVAGTVWASQAQGLFVSRNGAGTWTRLSLPASDASVSCVAVPPAGHPVYACAEGLWESADSGRTWRQIDAGLAATSFSSLVVDPSSPEILYASVNSLPNGGPAVYKSTTGGSSWLPSGNGVNNVAVAALAVDPAQAGTLYALISDFAGISIGDVNALLKSVDDGAHWAPANAGLPGFTVTALAINPQAPATLCAETNRAFFSSNDGGARWIRPGARFAGAPPLVVDPQTPTTLYTALTAGFENLYRSLDSGASWTQLGAIAAARSYFALAVAPSAPSTLYVAADLSVSGPSADLFASHDGGATFEDLGGGLRTVAAIAVDPRDPDTLYVSGSAYSSSSPFGIDFGVWKSADGGLTFSQLPGVSELASLLIDPANPSAIYGGGTYLPAGAELLESGDVLVSRDGGETWRQLAPGLPGVTVGQLAFGPAGTLYAGTQGAGIYRLVLDDD